MPQMGYDMQEGTVVRWLKSEGAEVALGEAVAEIETDKAVVEFESVASGVLRKILVSEGTSVAVGQPIAIVGEVGEELPEVVPEAAPLPDGGPTEAVPEAQPEVQEDGPPAPEREVRASPVARRLAEEKGIDLTKVAATGPGKRITRDDVLAYEASAATEKVPAPAEAPAPEEAPVTAAAMAPAAEPVSGEKVPLSRMRQQIARVTASSNQEIPHFYVSAEIDMTEALALRGQLNSGLKEEGIRISVNDLVIKACVAALKKHPKFNARFAGDGIQMNEVMNVGIAMAVDEGLIVPAILDCGNKSLPEIAMASKDLVERSKSGTLHPQEATGGTFSISNLGMFDVSSFVAIIHPTQSAVLAVGAIAKKPVVRDDQVEIADMMTATLSVDHRVADGAEGANFIVEVKRLLENPGLLLI